MSDIGVEDHCVGVHEVKDVRNLLVGFDVAYIVISDVDMSDFHLQAGQVDGGTGSISAIAENFEFLVLIKRAAHNLLLLMLNLEEGHWLQTLINSGLKGSAVVFIEFKAESFDLGFPVITVKLIDFIVSEDLALGAESVAVILRAELWEPMAEVIAVAGIPVTVLVAGTWIISAVLLGAIPVGGSLRFVMVGRKVTASLIHESLVKIAVVRPTESAVSIIIIIVSLFFFG